MADDTAALIAKRFIARRDVKAIQAGDGAYRPERSRPQGDEPAQYIPWSMGDLHAHLNGTRTYGHYLVTRDNSCRLFAFDIDLTKSGGWYSTRGDWVDGNPREKWLAETDGWDWLCLQLRCMAEGLAARTARLLDVPVAIAYSGGKGLHVYGFTGDVPAAEARGAAVDVLNSFGTFTLARGKNFWRYVGQGGDPRTGYPVLEIEVFPKQDDLDGKELGNLMRVPLGIHRKTGRAAFFVDPTAPMDRLVAMDPDAAMDHGIRW